MRRIYRKDFKTRVLYHNNEILTKVLKILVFNPYLPTILRVNAKDSLDLNSVSKTQFTNICLRTSRTRSVYRAFRLSRIKLRELSLAGKLPGVRKQS